MVVEDERIVAMEIQRVLKRLGYVVLAVAFSGEEAIQKAKKTRPDLVLMDIKLKGNMDGIDAAKQICVNFHIPVVYLTAYADEDTLQRAKITEPYSYIVKPIRERELHAIIEMAIHKHKAEEELKKSREELRNLSTYLQSVREEERTRIAREIHDELGQALTALKIDLSWLNNRLPEEQKPLFEKIESMSKLIDSTIQTVRRISSELRPGILDDLGIAAAIEWQAEEFQSRTGIKCEVTLEPEDIILDKDYSTTIFRICQEAMTNVARHANATRVEVSLKEKSGKLVLEVKDNGKGITEEQIADPKSFGLIGIRERTHFWEGEVIISGIPDKGTTVTVSIPFDKKKE